MEKNESLENDMISPSLGNNLVALARLAIEEKFGLIDADLKLHTLEESLPEAALRKNGTFVTLKIEGQLRGCIGNLTADCSIASGIKRNALNAAFNDYRFSPLSPDEFKKTAIEISILTDPQELPYDDSTDLLQKLRVGIDGIILQKGPKSSTFLPQVWSQLPEPENFLAHLCQKAGLAVDCWRHEKLEIQIYQVQHFP